MADRAQVVLEPEAMLPAACQGIVGITARADDAAASVVVVANVTACAVVGACVSGFADTAKL
jgi:porphobilinogen deaminase